MENTIYDSLLSRVFEESGFYHTYSYADADFIIPNKHFIRKKRKLKTVFHIPLIGTRKNYLVAEIVSEAEKAKLEHGNSSLKYDGLKIKVIDESYRGELGDVLERLKEELGESVVLS